MITKIIEACHVGADGKETGNWGKFMVCRFTDEWNVKSSTDHDLPFGLPLLPAVGWTPRHVLVIDLQTGEGAIFKPGGYPKADLEKHKIWVCPLFEPFLDWLYGQDLGDLTKLPSLIKFHLDEAPFAMRGYRRPGP